MKAKKITELIETRKRLAGELLIANGKKRLIEDKIREFGSMVILHKKKLSKDFQKAHRELNNQHTIAINTITEYSFYNGQEYAYLKILKYLQEAEK